MGTVYIVEVTDAKKPALPDSCVVCEKPRHEKLAMLLLSDEHSRVEFYL